MAGNSSPGQDPGPSLREIERRRHISDMRDRRLSGQSEGTFATMGGVSSVSSVQSSVHRVPLHELADACQGWDIKNKIGQGGYGTVYKGVWRYQEVAIKRIRRKEGASEEDLNKAIQQCFTEIETLSTWKYGTQVLSENYLFL